MGLGKPPDMVERAIADFLYNIVVDVNSAVLTQFFARQHENSQFVEA